MVTPGITLSKEITVSTSQLASSMKSGTLDVFATPAMIALMEETAMDSVSAHLDEGSSTVGTKINVEHLAASPVGAVIRCESELIEADGRRLLFKVRVWDDSGLVGQGTHERFIVDIERFMNKVNAKKTS